MLKLDGGVVVGLVKRDTVAARAGLKWADVIAEWDGGTVHSAEDLRVSLSRVSAGQIVRIKAFRGRKALDLTAQF